MFSCLFVLEQLEVGDCDVIGYTDIEGGRTDLICCSGTGES